MPGVAPFQPFVGWPINCWEQPYPDELRLATAACDLSRTASVDPRREPWLHRATRVPALSASAACASSRDAAPPRRSPPKRSISELDGPTTSACPPRLKPGEPQRRNRTRRGGSGAQRSPRPRGRQSVKARRPLPRLQLSPGAPGQRGVEIEILIQCSLHHCPSIGSFNPTTSGRAAARDALAVSRHRPDYGTATAPLLEGCSPGRPCRPPG